MVRIATLTAAAGLAAGVMTSDVTTTEMFIVGYTSQPMVASVVTSDSTATTYSVTCATSSGCALPASFTFTQGPSMVHYEYSHTPTATADPAASVIVGCSLSGSSGACSKTVEASLGTVTSSAVSSTITFTDGGSALGGQEVTITAGKLVIASTTASTTSSSSKKSSSSSSSSASKTSSHSSTTTVLSTATVEPEASTTAAPVSSSTDTAFFAATDSAISLATSSSSAGAMPMITALPQWVIGGAAAAVALAAF